MWHAMWLISLEAGDLLYVPCYWWHRVYSYGRNLAVSYIINETMEQRVRVAAHRGRITERHGLDHRAGALPHRVRRPQSPLAGASGHRRLARDEPLDRRLLAPDHRSLPVLLKTSADQFEGRVFDDVEEIELLFGQFLDRLYTDEGRTDYFVANVPLSLATCCYARWLVASDTGAHRFYLSVEMRPVLARWQERLQGRGQLRRA